MIVNTFTPAASAISAGASDASKASMNYDSFLKLLVATMRNQDPTQPNDPSQTMSQLASFSSVEQGIKTNAKLDALLSVAAAGEAGSLIGKTVTVSDGSLSGVVKSIEIGDQGLVAHLVSGAQLVMGPGVTVSDT